MNSKKGYEYRIKLSENMIYQGYGRYDKKPFESYDMAYNAVVGKWGSEVLGTPLGLVIQERKIGTIKWEDCQ